MALPPGPRTPDFIQAIQFRVRSLAYLDACAQRYGDIFTAGGNGASPSVYVSSPSVIQEMLAADNALFEPFREDWAARFLFGEDSMVFREGEGHQRERRLLTPPFHGERLRANADTIAGITCDVVDGWQAGEPFYVGPAMREITLRVIFRMMFDADEGERLQRLRHLFSSLMTSLNSPWRLTLFRLSAQIPLPLGAWRSPVATKEEIDRLMRLAGASVRTSVSDVVDSVAECCPESNGDHHQGNGQRVHIGACEQERTCGDERQLGLKPVPPPRKFDPVG